MATTAVTRPSTVTTSMAGPVAAIAAMTTISMARPATITTAANS